MEYTEVEMILIIGSLNSLVSKSMDMLKKYDSREIANSGYIEYMPVTLIRTANSALVNARDTLEKIRDMINENTEPVSGGSGNENVGGE